MAVAACPSPETLTAFARGDLAPEELSFVATHVGTCEVCCRALKLVPEDSLANLARVAAAADPTVESNARAPAGPVNAATQVPIATGEVPAGFADHPRYRIVSQLGAGGMGTVYKAEDRAMDRVVALKVVSPHLTAKSSALARFQKEIRAAAKLEHPNIIRAYDTGEAGGCQFLVMEFVEGISLDKFVARKGPLSVPMACLFTRQAALGLQHAAEKGMVHRDIKPQNLMVTRKGQVKVLDFGIARFASADAEESAPAARLPFGAGKNAADAGVTNPNLVMGTPDYLSPEQAKNSHDVDPRSDIYSLGCALYFLLTGKPPFAGATTQFDKLIAHMQDEPPAIREARPDVPEGLAEVLARMMAKNPAERYQKASEAASALLEYTRSDAGAKEPVFEIVEAVAVAPPVKPLPAALAPAGVLAFDTDAERESSTLPDAPRPRKKKTKKKSWWKKRRWAVLGGAAALLLLVGVLIAAGGKKPPADKASDPSASVNAKGNPPPKGEKDDKGKWTPPTVIAPTTGAKILYVLPSNGVWFDDYTHVRARLEEKGATVVTASTDGDRSKPYPDPRNLGEPVPIDRLLTANMDLSEYAAVVFAGANSDEYMSGKGSPAAAKVIQRMQTAGKPVAAICLGQGVLVAQGVLKGKKAAHCAPLMQKHSGITGKDSGITWDAPGVTIDGKVITASGGREAVPFADAILKAIEGK